MQQCNDAMMQCDQSKVRRTQIISIKVYPQISHKDIKPPWTEFNLSELRS